VFLLIGVEVVVFGDVVVGGEEEAAGAAGGVEDDLAGFGLHDLDHGLDERAGGEVLAGPFFRRSGILFQQAFVDLAFDIDVDRRPVLAIDHADEFFQLGRVGDFVLRLFEDGAQEAGFFSEVFQGVAVVEFEFVAGLGGKRIPVVGFRDRGLEAEGLPAPPPFSGKGGR
jgi:hypothetical protein